MAKKKLTQLTEFEDLCNKMASMHSRCEGGSKRKFVSCGMRNKDLTGENCCIVMFLGDVDDIFAIHKLLEERDVDKS